MLNEGKVVESGKKYHIIPLQQLEAKSQEKGCQVDQLKAARRLGRQYNVQSESLNKVGSFKSWKSSHRHTEHGL